MAAPGLVNSGGHWALRNRWLAAMMHGTHWAMYPAKHEIPEAQLRSLGVAELGEGAWCYC